MRADHYGWFEPTADTSRGVYSLTPKGHAALEEYAETVTVLAGGCEPGGSISVSEAGSAPEASPRT